jgi:hypothetical protein
VQMPGMTSRLLFYALTGFCFLALLAGLACGEKVTRRDQISDRPAVRSAASQRISPLRTPSSLSFSIISLRALRPLRQNKPWSGVQSIADHYNFSRAKIVKPRIPLLSQNNRSAAALVPSDLWPGPYQGTMCHELPGAVWRLNHETNVLGLQITPFNGGGPTRNGRGQ